MELALKDVDKHSMLFIGSQIVLTPDNPGPVVVNLDSLTKEEAQQILFNIKLGVLSTELDLFESAALEKRAEIGLVSQEATVSPVKKATKKSDDTELSPRKKEVMLKKILAKKINVIKSEAATLPVSDLRKLIDIERSNKNRKGLLPVLIEMFASHTDQVTENLKKIEDNSEKQGLSPQTFLDDLPDVVELDEKEVDIPLPE